MPSPFERAIESLGSQLDQAFKQGGSDNDFRRSAKVILSSTLERLDLVSREEFDAQTEVLAKTRAKLEQLEQQLLD